MEQGDNTQIPDLKIEKVIRLAGMREGGAEMAGAVIYYLENFTMRERIVQRAWTLGPCDFQGREVVIMPELTSSTLRCRGMLKPLREYLKQHVCTYRWGAPLHDYPQSSGSLFFFLHCPADLPALFDFMGSPPIDVPDWLQPWPAPAHRRVRPRKVRGEKAPMEKPLAEDPGETDVLVET